MPSSILVGLGLAAEVAAVCFCLVTAFRAFSLSRALPGRVYRIRAEWTGVFSIMIIGVTAILFAAASGFLDPYATNYLNAVGSGMFIFSFVALLAWIGSTIGVAFELDFFHRDTLHWGVVRKFFWIGVGAAMVVSIVGTGITYCSPGNSCGDVGQARLVISVSDALVGALAVYASAVLYVSSRRSPDKIMRNHLKWLALFAVTFILAILAPQVFPLFIVVGTYFLFRASGYLSPADRMGSIDIQIHGARSERAPSSLPSSKYRVLSSLGFILALLLTAFILVFDHLLWKIGNVGPVGLAGEMIVYGIVVGLLATNAKLGFTLGCISSAVMLSFQVLQLFSGPPENSANIAQYFPHGFLAYVLGFAPVHDSTLCPLACPPGDYSALALLLANALLVITCYMGLRTEMNEASVRFRPTPAPSV